MPSIKIPVPEYGDRKIQEGDIPGVRVQPGATVETFGGGPGLERIREGVESTALNVQKYAFEAQKAADEIAVQDSDLQVSLSQNKIQSEILKKTGKDAAGAKDYLDQEWKKTSEDALKSVSNDRQRQMLEKKLFARYSSLDEFAQKHMAVQFKQHDENSTKSFIENERNDAALNAGDPKKVAESLFRQEETFKKYADRNGLGEEELKNGLSEIRTQTHMAAIDGLLTSGDTAAAKSYYEQNKKQITGKDAKGFVDYLDSRTKRVEAEKAYQQKQVYSQNLRKTTLDLFDGNLTINELKRRYREGEIDLSGYNSVERKFTDEYKWYQKKGAGDSGYSSFNEIRSAINSGDFTPRQINDMILEKSDLQPEDATYLTKLIKEVPPSPKEKSMESNAAAIREFGERYISENWMDRIFNQKKKDQEVESMVSEFYKRVDSENPDAEKMSAIAKEITFNKVKKRYPELSKYEDMPHVVIDAKGKVQRLLSPDNKTNIKPDFTVTRNKAKAPDEKNKK